ncbi:MAG: HRDC domain-containing protein, partial [Acidimicrobiales bacterium]
RTGAARSGPAPSGSPGPALDAPAEARAEALRGWRLERARASGAPAYVVLHNRTIEAIARAAPADLAALARIEGIGPAKLELYGEEILEVLAAAQPL